MKCKIKDCEREAMYKGQRVCQKHYFRYMRYGTYDRSKPRKYRLSNPKGYQLLYEKDHPLAQNQGYVYEHRFVVYNKTGKEDSSCDICGAHWSWDNIYNCHIDHIDNDVTNNSIKNLRKLCNSCNVSGPQRSST